MSSAYPPLECDEVKRILKNLGFSKHSQQGSHEHYCRVSRKHGLLKVTVDCPKSPFTKWLLSSMAAQAKLNKKEFYLCRDKKKAATIVKRYE